MDEALSQLYSRVTVQEFAIELLLCDFITRLPRDEREPYLAEIASRFRDMWVAGDPLGDDTSQHRIVSDAQKFAGLLTEKVRQRLVSRGVL